MESEGHGGGDGDNMGYTSVGGDSSKKVPAQRPQN